MVVDQRAMTVFILVPPRSYEYVDGCDHGINKYFEYLLIPWLWLTVYIAGEYDRKRRFTKSVNNKKLSVFGFYYYTKTTL